MSQPAWLDRYACTHKPIASHLGSWEEGKKESCIHTIHFYMSYISLASYPAKANTIQAKYTNNSYNNIILASLIHKQHNNFMKLNYSHKTRIGVYKLIFVSLQLNFQNVMVKFEPSAVYPSTQPVVGLLIGVAEWLQQWHQYHPPFLPLPTSCIHSPAMIAQSRFRVTN